MAPATGGLVYFAGTQCEGSTPTGGIRFELAPPPRSSRAPRRRTELRLWPRALACEGAQPRLEREYGELAKLDSDGLLSFKTTKLKNRPAKKVYSLNRAGRLELRRLLIEVEPRSTSRDELLVHILAARHAPQAVLSRLVARSHLYQRQIAELKARLDETDRSSDGGLWITLDAALTRAKADAAWCKRAIAALRGVKS